MLALLSQMSSADGSDEDTALCRNYNCSASGRYDCPTGGYCMGSLCDICNDMGANYSICPDGSDQKPQFCHLKPPKENCSIPIDDCNPALGICYAKGGPVPNPVPGSVPSPVPAPVMTSSQNETRSLGNTSTDSKAALSYARNIQHGNLLIGLLVPLVLGLIGFTAQ